MKTAVRMSIVFLLLFAQGMFAEQVQSVWSRFAPESSAKAVLRLDLDVTGDGEAEIFLTDSSRWEKRGYVWQVFSPHGSSFFYLGTVRFHEGLIIFEPNEGKLVVFEPMQINRLHLVEYQVERDGLREVSRREVFETVDREVVEEIAVLRRRMEGFRRSGAYSVCRAQVSEVGGGDPPKPIAWRDLQTGRPVAGLRRIAGTSQVEFTQSAAEVRPLYRQFLDERPCSWPDSCEVLLFELDVTGDGTREIFLNITEGYPGRGWRIYSPEGEGTRFLGELRFMAWGFRYDEERGSLIVMDRDERKLRTYRLGASGIKRLDEIDWSINWSRLGRPEQERMDAWRESGAVEILKVPVADFESDPATAPWKSWEDEQPIVVNTNLAAPVTGGPVDQGEEPPD